MRISVAQQKRQAVGGAFCRGHLQSVVVRAVQVSDLIYVLQVWKLGVGRSGRFRGSIGSANAAAKARGNRRWRPPSAYCRLVDVFFARLPAVIADVGSFQSQVVCDRTLNVEIPFDGPRYAVIGIDR